MRLRATFNAALRDPRRLETSIFDAKAKGV
ncbi:hypothetical protein F383_34705 [Gossypium arboreum]|nr:hypothetical protein F383_34705 [Gossypium arboreum]